jgi:hypothetical protein
MIENGNAASSEVPTEEVTETIPLSANGETVGEIQPATTEPTDGDDEGDVKPESEDGKFDANKVNEIVKRRVEKVRVKTREEVQKKADEEIEFWRQRASAQRQETANVLVPPKPKMIDYASNPTQYEKDLEAWSVIKAKADDYTANIVRAYQARSNEFAKDKPDFTKSVQFFNSVTVEPALNSSILESEHGPALAYYLSKNLKEFDRINKMSPISVAREIAKLELKLTGQLKEDGPVTKTKVVPKPTATVSGSAPASEKMEHMVKNDPLKFLKERKKVHAQNAIRRG